jgi:hypothetical protein
LSCRHFALLTNKPANSSQCWKNWQPKNWRDSQQQQQQYHHAAGASLYA